MPISDLLQSLTACFVVLLLRTLLLLYSKWVWHFDQWDLRLRNLAALEMLAPSVNNRWLTISYSRNARNTLKVGRAYWEDVCFNFHSLVARHYYYLCTWLGHLYGSTALLLWLYCSTTIESWTANFANPCPTIVMQSLDTGDQEDRVQHCVIQMVALLLSFHVTKLTRLCWK